MTECNRYIYLISLCLCVYVIYKMHICCCCFFYTINVGLITIIVYIVCIFVLFYYHTIIIGSTVYPSRNIHICLKHDLLPIQKLCLMNKLYKKKKTLVKDWDRRACVSVFVFHWIVELYVSSYNLFI